MLNKSLLGCGSCWIRRPQAMRLPHARAAPAEPGRASTRRGPARRAACPPVPCVEGHLPMHRPAAPSAHQPDASHDVSRSTGVLQLPGAACECWPITGLLAASIKGANMVLHPWHHWTVSGNHAVSNKIITSPLSLAGGDVLLSQAAAMHAGAGGSGEEDEAGAPGVPRTRRTARASRLPPDSPLLDDSGGHDYLCCDWL